MTDAEEYQHGYQEGLHTALALLAKHIEKMKGFDSEAFKKDISDLLQMEQGSPEHLYRDYMHGFRGPLEALKQEGHVMGRFNVLDINNEIDRS